MNTVRTTIATFVTAIALSPALIAEHEVTGNPVSSSSTAKSGMQLKTELEGKIMTLREYLGASTLSSMSTSQSATTAGNDRYRTSPRSTSTQDLQPGQERAGQDRAGQADKPAQQNGNPFSTSGSTTSTTGSAATPMGDEPLVFIVQSEPATSSADRTDGKPATSTTSRNQLSAQTSTTSYAGGVYILLCDPNDAGSRTAFAHASSLRHSRSTGTAAESPTSDRLRVKGTDESRNSADQKLNESDPNATVDGARKAAVQRELARANWHGGQSGKTVKISGKVLARGGLQAIEITSMKDLDGTPDSPRQSDVPQNK